MREIEEHEKRTANDAADDAALEYTQEKARGRWHAAVDHAKNSRNNGVGASQPSPPSVPPPDGFRPLRARTLFPNPEQRMNEQPEDRRAQIDPDDRRPPSALEYAENEAAKHRLLDPTDLEFEPDTSELQEAGSGPVVDGRPADEIQKENDLRHARDQKENDSRHARDV